MRGFTRFAAAALGAVLLAACGGDEPDVQPIEPTAAPTAEAEPEPEPAEPEDPYAIPDEIDVAYVQSVLDAILEVPEGPLIEAYRTGPHTMPPQDLIDALRATRTPDVAASTFARHLTELSDESIIADRLAVLEDAPPLRWAVQDVEVGSDECVIVRFEYPAGGATPEGRAALVRTQGQRDPGGLNPTPWLIDQSGSAEALSVADLEERCAVDHFADETEEDAA